MRIVSEAGGSIGTRSLEGGCLGCQGQRSEDGRYKCKVIKQLQGPTKDCSGRSLGAEEEEVEDD